MKIETKKYFISCAVLLIFFTSCTTDSKVETVYDSNIIQQKLGEEVSSDIYMIIERIGKDHSIAQELLRNITFDNDLLNLDDIRRVDYGWSNFNVFEISFKNNPNKRLSIFNIDDRYLTTITEISVINSHIKTVNVRSTTNEDLYSFDMIDDTKFANFTDINFGYSYAPEILSGRRDYDAMEDCGRYPFSQCMQCGFDVCSQDWRCQAAATISGPAFVAGLAITCGLRQVL